MTHHKHIDERFRDIAGMQRVMGEAVEEAVRRHVLAGRRIPVWREGEVVWITPELTGTSPLEGQGN
jgi:hypothetical protein